MCLKPIVGRDLNEEAVIKSCGGNGRMKCAGFFTPEQVHLSNMVVVFSKVYQQGGEATPRLDHEEENFINVVLCLNKAKKKANG